MFPGVGTLFLNLLLTPVSREQNRTPSWVVAPRTVCYEDIEWVLIAVREEGAKGTMDFTRGSVWKKAALQPSP